MKSWSSTAFTVVWAFELAILMSRTACSGVPWCGSHKIWYLGLGFVCALVVTLINFADRLSSRKPRRMKVRMRNAQRAARSRRAPLREWETP
jgi:hypothetical protein